MSQTRRVVAYVDGYNLYYGMKAAGFQRFMWLDLPTLMARFLRPDQMLAGVKFFTSRINAPPESVRRQTTYIDALKSRAVTVVEGRHGGDPEVCACGRRYATHSEKMTDVNIALAITRDAHENEFDTAFLVTGDSDQVPTIKLIRDFFPLKRVVVLLPPARGSQHLREVAHVALSINANHLRHSQLPDLIPVDGAELRRPGKWI